jgi:broad specificity phosphatase PhoE
MMSCLLFVRHGQASAGSDDYDRLSDLGKYQARILGEHWAARGLVLERVVVGTHRRHLETAEAAGRAFADAGGRWPEPESRAAFDEHAGYEVVLQALEELPAVDPQIGAWVETLRANPETDLETFWRAFRYITHLWARGELELSNNRHETWQAFRSRVEAGLRALAAETPEGRNVAIFTSAGPSGVAAAAALELADAPAMELSWKVQNSAVTEILPSSRGLRLKCFNSASHLPSADLVTMV